MTLRTSLVALTLLAVMTPDDADARRRRSFGGSKSNYVSNGKFGLGLELGGPSGLNGKYFLGPSNALNFGVGYDNEGYYGYRYGRRGIHLYLDHLWHPAELTQNETFKLPFYVGVGVRFWDWEDEDGFDGSVLGVRGPLGLAFDFNNVPLDIFIQVTLVLDFLFDEYDRRDRAYLHLEGSFGARFWFD